MFQSLKINIFSYQAFYGSAVTLVLIGISGIIINFTYCVLFLSRKKVRSCCSKNNKEEYLSPQSSSFGGIRFSESAPHFAPEQVIWENHFFRFVGSLKLFLEKSESIYSSCIFYIRMFHRTTICREHNHPVKNFVLPINTRFPVRVMQAIKLMAWRQTASPLKITTWSGGSMLSSQIS